MSEKYLEGPVVGGPLSAETDGRFRSALSSVAKTSGRAAIAGMFFVGGAAPVAYVTAPLIGERIGSSAAESLQEESNKIDLTKPQFAKMKANIKREPLLPMLADKLQQETDGMSIQEVLTCLTTPEEDDPTACDTKEPQKTTSNDEIFVTEDNIVIFQERIENGLLDTVERRSYSQEELFAIFFAPEKELELEPIN